MKEAVTTLGAENGWFCNIVGTIVPKFLEEVS